MARVLILVAALALAGCAEFGTVLGKLEPIDPRATGCAPKGKLNARDVRVGAVCRF